MCKIWLIKKNEILVGLTNIDFPSASVVEINVIRDEIATSMWHDYTGNS